MKTKPNCVHEDIDITIANADCEHCPAFTNICEAPPDYQCTVFRKKYTEQLLILANELLNKGGPGNENK